MLEIVQYPHPALRYSSRPVTEIDDNLRATIRAMFELMYAAKGIGLAANQVALPFRFFILNVTADPEQNDKEQVFINPEIVKRHSSIEDEEGCLSLPGLYAKVRRARKIRVRAYDLEGNLVEHEADELFSRADSARDRPSGRQAVHRLPGAPGAAFGWRQAAHVRARVSQGPGKRHDSAGRGPCQAAGYDVGAGLRRCRRGSVRSAMTDSLRIIMLGTGDFALPTFEHLIETGHECRRSRDPARPAARAQARVDPQPHQAVGAVARESPSSSPTT